jgi:hypothetical protein
VTTSPPTLLEVHIVGMPLDVYQEASEHTDELLREFTLIRDSETENPANVPARLVSLVNELTERFSGFTTQQEAELHAAVERGDATLDLAYRVPPEVEQAALELDRMLDEADAFCRSGSALLTLASPPRTVAFRRWFLHEFVRQAAGQPPMRWAEFSGQHA